MFLERVALARDEGYQLLPVAEPNATALAIGRVGFFGFPDHGLEYDALHLRPAGHGAARLRPLLHWALSDYLVHSPTAGRGGVQPSDGRQGEPLSAFSPCVGSRRRRKQTKNVPDSRSGQHGEGRSSLAHEQT